MRILAIDFGTKRVGAALSDPRGLIASPLEVYERRSDTLDADHYRALADREGVEQIVVGLPVHTAGHEGASARLARRFGEVLGAATGRPVTFFDERYTTVEADAMMHGAGLSKSARKAKRDMMAALALLRAYIEAGSPTTDAAPLPLDDREDLP